MPHSDHMSFCTAPSDQNAHTVHGECETTFTIGKSTFTVTAVACGRSDPEIRGRIAEPTLAEFDTAVELLAHVRQLAEKWKQETYCPDPSAHDGG